MSVDTALKYVISMGVVAPPSVHSKQAAVSEQSVAAVAPPIDPTIT
jgi:uncharacterized membrane protein